MKQVSHAEKVIQLLGDATNKHNNLQSMLEAQLSHSDGIRGFFVTYLTGTGDTSPADNPTVPDVLQKAMTQVDEKELVPLACKYACVVMLIKTGVFLLLLFAHYAICHSHVVVFPTIDVGMNVVMPTGMITMHEDPNLSEQSKKTAERGSRILASLNNNQLVQDNCRAILAVAHTMDDKDAASAEAKPDLVQVSFYQLFAE